MTDQAVARGNQALDQGRWVVARTAFEEALTRTDSAEAWRGLAFGVVVAGRNGRRRRQCPVLAPFTTADGSVDAPFFANLVVGRRS